MSSPLPEGYEIVEPKEKELNKPSEEVVDPFFTQRDHKIMNEVSINRLKLCINEFSNISFKGRRKVFCSSSCRIRTE